MMQKKRVILNKLSIDVRAALGASGRPIVMVHGIGVSGSYFLRLAKELAGDHKVFVVDLPGYGKTPKPPEPLDIPQLASVLDEFIRHYQLEQPILIGQSMGCQIVVQLAKTDARAYPEVVLLGPTVNRKEASRLQQGARLIQDSFREPFKLNTIIFRDYARMGMFRYLRTSSFMVRNRIEENIKSYTGRVLIVRGARDPIAPQEWCQYLADIAHDGSFQEITEAAHVVQYTKPKELGAICRKFIRS
jgi:pimeloyl-ACP methyl ester carboxylesterase